MLDIHSKCVNNGKVMNYLTQAVLGSGSYHYISLFFELIATVILENLLWK